MGKKKILVKLVGRDAHAAYVSLPGYEHTPGIVAKTLRLDDLVKQYEGPQVRFDFSAQGKLIGIEILA